ncbi:MAG: hypothetical protein GF331_03820 [Chitinivibrionales bacterium]|nr:hypothetical protein [Chitinivibrionales bacterium]
MEELFGLIVWVIIIIAVSVFRRMQSAQRNAPATQTQGEKSGPSLQDLLRDLGAELSGTSEGAQPQEEHRKATERLRGETRPSQKGSRDLRSQPTKVEAQERERFRDKRMRNEPRREAPSAETDLEQLKERARRRYRPAAVKPTTETASYGGRISSASAHDLRQGFIWAEVLGKPVSQREVD